MAHWDQWGDGHAVATYGARPSSEKFLYCDPWTGQKDYWEYSDMLTDGYTLEGLAYFKTGEW